jgi:sulfite dehydrogenase (cytochrome) subunit B
MKAVVNGALAALFVAGALGAWAGEEKVKLKEGPGLDKVRQNCIACHSLDYIPLNSPFLDQKGWEATVTKMQKAYGAPVAQQDVVPIATYLATYYGKR